MNCVLIRTRADSIGHRNGGHRIRHYGLFASSKRAENIARVRQLLAVPEPQTEDWGWYVDLEYNGRKYMLGASASDEEENGGREWVLQIVKHRFCLLSANLRVEV